MENLELYNRYRTPPKEALKSFDNGNFKGTDINTIWRIKCLTETFGICGFGWTTELVRQWSEPAPNDEILCFVEIKMYIKVDGEWSRGFSAIGGSKVVQYFKSKDYCKGNDEGYKMAYTDALGVACKYLGFGADIYWDNDRTKYTAEKEDLPTTLVRKKLDVKETASKVVADALKKGVEQTITDDIINDVYFQGSEAGYDEDMVDAVVSQLIGKLKVEDITISEANALIKKFKAKAEKGNA